MDCDDVIVLYLSSNETNKQTRKKNNFCRSFNVTDRALLQQSSHPRPQACLPSSSSSSLTSLSFAIPHFLDITLIPLYTGMTPWPVIQSLRSSTTGQRIVQIMCTVRPNVRRPPDRHRRKKDKHGVVEAVGVDRVELCVSAPAQDGLANDAVRAVISEVRFLIFLLLKCTESSDLSIGQLFRFLLLLL